ncbi:MAG: cation transporter [Gammaproteobacteria bacterium]|nr:cation transporter [Gammaproteobacteria bacterium]
MSHHAHDHDHDNGHGHRNGHGAGGHAAAHCDVPKDFGAAFAIGITLNLGFVGIEAIYGFLSHSMALLADAGHNLGDVFGLVMAWVAAVLARRPPSPKYTYGLRRGTIVAALGNAVVLLVSVGAIVVEGVHRLIDPVPVAGHTVMAVAGIGIVLNGLTAWLFASGRNRDVNLRAAFLHMAYDALISAGVVVAAGVILLTGWVRLDAIVSLAIAAVIVIGTWSLLRDSLGLSLDAVPRGVPMDAVRGFLEERTGVQAVHDLHVWPMSTTETALTCHCVVPAGHPGDRVLAEWAQELNARFGIGHVTIQVEVDEHVDCALEPDHVV